MNLKDALEKTGAAKRRPYENDPNYWLIVGWWTHLDRLRLADHFAEDWVPHED